MTTNFDSVLSSVGTVINRYNKAKNIEINREADRKRNYKNKVEEDEKNYKAISDLFVELLICYYAYDDFYKYKQKMKQIFEFFQQIFSNYIKEILNNEFSEPKMLLEAIKSRLTRLVAALQPAAQVEHQRPPLRPADAVPDPELQGQVHQRVQRDRHPGNHRRLLFAEEKQSALHFEQGGLQNAPQADHHQGREDGRHPRRTQPARNRHPVRPGQPDADRRDDPRRPE